MNNTGDRRWGQGRIAALAATSLGTAAGNDGALWSASLSSGDIVLRIGAVFALLILIALLARRLGGVAFTRMGEQSAMQVVEVLSLGPQRALYVVRVGERGLVIGVTARTIRLLCELDHTELDSLLRGRGSGLGQRRFLDVFRQQLQRERSGRSNPSESPDSAKGEERL